MSSGIVVPRRLRPSVKLQKNVVLYTNNCALLSYMNTAQVKFLVSLAIVLALWRVFEIPGVSTAFWALITAGVIPGSNEVLGSETMLRILCILFAVCFFLIFRKEFMASLPTRKLKPAKLTPASSRETAAAPVAQPVRPEQPNPLERSVIILNHQKDQPALQVVRPLLVALCFVVAGIVAFVTKAEHWAERFMRASARRIKRLTLIVYRLARFAGRKTYRYLYVFGRIIVRAVILGWRAAEPHIRTFDHWLEMQLRANRNTAQVIRGMDSFGRTAVEGYRRAQNAKRKLLEDK